VDWGGLRWIGVQRGGLRWIGWAGGGAAARARHRDTGAPGQGAAGRVRARACIAAHAGHLELPYFFLELLPPLIGLLLGVGGLAAEESLRPGARRHGKRPRASPALPTLRCTVQEGGGAQTPALRSRFGQAVLAVAMRKTPRHKHSTGWEKNDSEPRVTAPRRHGATAPRRHGATALPMPGRHAPWLPHAGSPCLCLLPDSLLLLPLHCSLLGV